MSRSETEMPRSSASPLTQRVWIEFESADCWTCSN